MNAEGKSTTCIFVPIQIRKSSMNISKAYLINSRIESLIFVFRNNTQLDASTDILSRKGNKIQPALPRDEATLSRLTEVVEDFDQLNLREPLLRGIYGYGFERPSNVQQRALKPCISGSFSIISLNLEFVE